MKTLWYTVQDFLAGVLSSDAPQSPFADASEAEDLCAYETADTNWPGADPLTDNEFLFLVATRERWENGGPIYTTDCDGGLELFDAQRIHRRLRATLFTHKAISSERLTLHELYQADPYAAERRGTLLVDEEHILIAIPTRTAPNLVCRGPKRYPHLTQEFNKHTMEFIECGPIAFDLLALHAVIPTPDELASMYEEDDSEWI